jgi:hypothetical protein
MNKAWIIFLLVLIISAQFVALSLFHEVDTEGSAYGVTVVSIAKWNYVGASFELSFSTGMIAQNGSVAPLTMLFPNGTRVTVASQSYSATLLLPRAGDFVGESAISGPVAISESDPMNVTIAADVGNATSYEATLRSEMNIPDLQLYFVVVYGQADILVNGFGFAP